MSKKTLLTTVPEGPACCGAPPNRLPSILTEVAERCDGRRRRVPRLLAGAIDDNRADLLLNNGDERGAQASAELMTVASAKTLFVSMEADRGKIPFTPKRVNESNRNNLNFRKWIHKIAFHSYRLTHSLKPRYNVYHAIFYHCNLASSYC